jgi:hypothetical protein
MSLLILWWYVNPIPRLPDCRVSLDIELALMTISRASELAQSVYGLVQQRSRRKILRKVNAAGKITAVIVPFVIILILRTPPVQRSPLAFTVITDIPCMHVSRFRNCHQY